MINTFEPEPMTVARATSHEHSGTDYQAGTPSALLQCDAPRPAARAVTAPVLSFSIPREDRAEFRQLPGTEADPLREQNLVQLRLRLMEKIHSAVLQGRGARSAAERIERETHRRFSAERLRKLYAKFTEQDEHGNLVNTWRCLIDRRAVPAESGTSLKYETIQFFIALVESNQRCAARAHYEMIKIWREHYDSRGRHHRAIPGYVEWPPAFGKYERPKGWSYDNLMRLARKAGMDNHTLTASRIGLAAASAHRPKVLTTRVGTRIGQQVQFDDHQLNLKVYLPGTDDPQRPEGYFAWDRFSGSMFAHWIKPMLWDEHDEKRRVITEKDFRYFIAAYLLRFGYRRDAIGTELVVEHAKACIREGSDFEQALFDAVGNTATEKFLTINRSGRFGKGAHGGQYDPARPGMGRGNFRNKAGVEGFFSIVDNWMAALRGQVGKDRLHCPEQMQGMDREHAEALAIMKRLAPEDAALVATSFLKWHDFHQQYQRLMREIDLNREHECEGWAQMPGFGEMEFRTHPLALEWRPVALLNELAEDQRRREVELIEANPALRRAVQLSRGEAFAKFRHELTPLPWCELPQLLGAENAQGEYAVQQGVISFENADFGPGKFYYDAADSSASGRPVRFANGEKFLCFGNYMAREYLVACDARGRVAGILPRVNIPSAGDEAGQRARLGQINAWQAERQSAMNARHVAEAEFIRDRREHNAAVREGFSSTAAMQQQRRTQAAAERQAVREEAAATETAHSALGKLTI